MQKNKTTKRLFKNQLSQTENSIIIVSAFVTRAGFKFLQKNLDDSVQEKLIIFRGRLKDFQQQITEFNFRKALNQDWQIYINLDLHAKMYIFDRENIIIGSSNLTKGGLASNKEKNIIKSFTDKEEKEIEEIIDSSTSVNEENSERIVDIVNQVSKAEDYSFYEMRQEWLRIFSNSLLLEAGGINRENFFAKERFFLEKRVSQFRESLLESPDRFLDQINLSQIDYDLPRPYVINISDPDIDIKNFHFHSKKYRYLVKLYYLRGDYYREKIDLPPLEEKWYELGVRERQNLLEKVIKAVKYLYSKNIMVNLDWSKIYYFEPRVPRLKFAEYARLKEKFPVKKTEKNYREKLSEYFGKKKEISEFRLESENSG